MNTIRQELENYLSDNYPNASIDTEHTLAGEITIRFNSTEDESSDDKDRINQAVERATLIWHELFDKTDNALWIIAYEYLGDDIIEYESDYFFQQFNLETASEFVSNEEVVNARTITIDENGNEVFEKTKARIIVGKAYLKNVIIESLLLGISNRDNGYEPVIGQNVYFLDPVNNTGFHINDDRGFFAWANNADKLRTLYNTYGNWISGYTKEDIEPFFQ